MSGKLLNTMEVSGNGTNRARTCDLMRVNFTSPLAYQSLPSLTLVKTSQTRTKCGTRGTLWHPEVLREDRKAAVIPHAERARITFCDVRT
jgi:hypothetical protein